MKILYATQKTGNGHIARAQELLPILRKYGQVDILASGSQAQLKLEEKAKYEYSGISLFYDKKGAVSIWKTIQKNDFREFFRLIYSFPIEEYDLIINDYEPITAWACKLRGGNIIGMSHQAALYFSDTPKTKSVHFVSRMIIRYYAPTRVKYGFHFLSYHENIFRPIIRKKIRQLTPTIHEKYLVYLPSHSDGNLLKKLGKLNTEFHVFSRHAKENYSKGNCHFYPVNEIEFLKELSECKGVLCNAGFELPSEALFLKKKLFVIPIKKQLEQEYNAKALKQLGIPTSKKIVKSKIEQWIDSEDSVQLFLPDETEQIIQEVMQKHLPKEG